FQPGQFGVAHLDRGLIVVRVQRRLHDQAGACRRAGDQTDDSLAANQRPATPVLGNEAEEPVLDLVPLAGAWREVADDQPDPQVVGQLLQAHLPKPGARAVGAAAVGGDQEFAGAGEAAASHFGPPAADAVGGELRGIVVDADADPSLVVENVVDAVGNHLAQRLVLEVMHADLIRAALGAPLTPAVAEIPNQFLLFGVHRDRRLPMAQAIAHLAVDVAELGIAVRMRAPLAGFAVGLEAVAGRMQQRSNRAQADRVALSAQLFGQPP